MAQQTAMQNLIAWGDEMLLKHPQKILSFAEAIDKAQELLQMEKEQIINAWDKRVLRGTFVEGWHIETQNGEEYYKETYGSDNQI